MQKTTDDSFGLNNLNVGTITFNDGTQQTTSMNMANYPTLTNSNVFTGTNTFTGSVVVPTNTTITGTSTNQSGVLNFISTPTQTSAFDCRIYSNGGTIGSSGQGQMYLQAVGLFLTAVNNISLAGSGFIQLGGASQQGNIYVGGTTSSSTGGINIGTGTGATGLITIGSATQSITASGLLTANLGLTLPSAQKITFGDATQQTTAFIPANIPTLSASNTFTGTTNTFNAISCTGETDTGTLTATAITASGLLTANLGLTLPSAQKITFGDATQQTTAFIPANIPTLSASNTFTGVTNSFNAITCTGETDTGNLTASAITASGMLTTNGGLTTTTNITLPVTYITPTVNQLGYQIIVGLATTTAITNNVIFPVTATGISIPAYGIWLVNYQFVLSVTIQPVTITSFYGGISTTASSNPTWKTCILSYASHTIPTTGGLNMITESSTQIVYSSGAVQTLFLNCLVNFTTTTGVLSCFGPNQTFIQAVRIA